MKLSALRTSNASRQVAPARERGLKCVEYNYMGTEGRRSREGAWIEILIFGDIWSYTTSRSREGAWIEIKNQWFHNINTDRRSREGAWIEIISVKNF